MARRVIEDRPDRAAIEDLRTSVVDLADAVAERGLDRAERVARARQAAEAAGHVATAARLLDPYRSGEFSELQDRARSVAHEGMLRGLSRDDAADRLMLRELALKVPAGALTMPASPFGGVDAAVDVLNRVPQVAAWLSEFAQVVPFRRSEDPDVAPVPWAELPAATLNPTVELTPAEYDIPAEPVEWDMAAVYWGLSAQVLHWTAAALAAEHALRMSVWIKLEEALIARLVTAATVAADFEAAEAAAGGAWPGGGADLVLTSSTDLPKVRRMYAAENLPADLRPRIMATSGVPTGTALVMVTAGVDVRRTEFNVMAAQAPAFLGLDVAGVMTGAVTLTHPGVVAKVDLTAGA